MFENKRILVTGSSRGIGYGIAEAFIKSGAKIAINGRTPESVATAMETLGHNDQLIAAPGDISTVAKESSVANGRFSTRPKNTGAADELMGANVGVIGARSPSG